MRLRSSLLLAFMLCILGKPLIAQRGSQIPTPRPSTPQHTDVRFQLVPTQNVWTFLLLDSSTGRMWQVHFAVADSAFSGRLALNEDVLVPAGGAHIGRFAVRETQNIFTFLLLDQDDGRVWQVQWSNEERNRGIVKALATAQP